MCNVKLCNKGEIPKYKSKITGHIWSSEGLERWEEDFYGHAERNLYQYKRPANVKKLIIKNLKLEEI